MRYDGQQAPRICCDGHDPLALQVNYSDGDVETVWLAAERVRLALAPGEALPAPGPDALRQLASQLQAGAGAAEHRAPPLAAYTSCGSIASFWPA